MNEHAEPQKAPHSGGDRYGGYDPRFSGRGPAVQPQAYTDRGMRYGAVPPQAHHQAPDKVPDRAYSQAHHQPAVSNGAQNTAAPQGSCRNNTDLLSLFNGLQLDEEKVVIIFLIVILAKNGADLPLLAALGYLLM